MNKINTFDELYKTSISIIENKNNSYENYSVTEIINFIRLNSEKDILNSYYIVGNIPNYIAEKIQAKTIITDYVDTGKGFTSFLEILSNYAQDLGVLDEFGHSVEILSIGSKEYRQNKSGLSYVSDPHIYMPKLLEPYDVATTPWGTGQIIPQKYFNIDYDVFMEMLINQNPNECRSTYYPSYTWTMYKPDKFKMGIIKDVKKIKEFIKNMQSEKPVFIFDPVMSAYRNLLNFRILDGLNSRGLLKIMHHTKM